MQSVFASLGTYGPTRPYYKKPQFGGGTSPMRSPLEVSIDTAINQFLEILQDESDQPKTVLIQGSHIIELTLVNYQLDPDLWTINVKVEKSDNSRSVIEAMGAKTQNEMIAWLRDPGGAAVSDILDKITRLQGY